MEERFEDRSNLNQLRELQEDLATTERELITRDALLAAVVQNAKDSIIARDLNGTVIVWNPASERLYGWKAEEMIGEKIYKIIPPDKIQEHEKFVEEIRVGKAIGPLRTERITKDGHEICVELSISPVVSRNGEILGASAIEHEVHDE